MNTLIITYSALIVLTILTRPFTVLLHEFGHAIPAVLISKKPVSIFIGSYGDTKHSLNFKIWNFFIWIRYNPIGWRGGVCYIGQNDFCFNEKIIILVCGPIFSILSIAALSFFVFYFNLHGSLRLIFGFALMFSIIDLFTNLMPRVIRLHNGELLQNDGYQIIKIIKSKQFLKK